MKRLAVFIFFLNISFTCAFAQFFVEGTEPTSTKWREINTDNYRIVYPSVMDSLAKVYASALEKWRPRVAATIGILPNQAYRKPMPVVLHPFGMTSNGTVSWSPRIVNLYCTPDASNPMPMKWEDQLVSHESRHVAQMQAGASLPVMRALTGELWAGAAAAVYGGPAFLEGDAVVAETELSSSGRGRTASFMEYYRTCFENGDWRNYWKWRYGSLTRYTPDYYSLGYLTEAGVRSISDSPYYARDFYGNILSSRGWRFFNFQKSLTRPLGKPFPEAFREIQELFRENWAACDSLRAPFTQAVTVTSSGKYYVEYRELCPADDRMYAIRSGYDKASEFVEILGDGSVKTIHSASPSAESLAWSPATGRIFFQEIIVDRRWEAVSESAVRYLDPVSGKTGTLCRGRYFNLGNNEDGSKLTLTEYPVQGGSAIIITDAVSGEILETHHSPDGVQFVESCMAGDKIYVIAVTEEGSGIYDIDGLRPVVRPETATVADLRYERGFLTFTSDRDGSVQAYSADPSSGELRKLSSTRFGGDCFRLFRDSLYFTAFNGNARSVYRCLPDSALSHPGGLPEIYRDPIAEKLSSQARCAGSADASANIGEAKDYSRLGHLFNAHSWLPVYFNYDEISEISAETIGSCAGLGATGFFQNELGTLYGYAGAAFWTPEDGSSCRAHASVTYRGLYPVLDASFDAAGDSRRGDFSAWIPWNFSSGGWSRGVIPQLSFTLTNDMSAAVASIRGYVIRMKPQSCIYPRIGAGLEIGNIRYFTPDLRLGAVDFYGYLPGVCRTHGIRFSASSRWNRNVRQSVCSLTYALPFAPVEWSFLSPIAYVRNFELFLKGTQERVTGRDDVTGAGASVNAVLGNLLWIPYDTRIGMDIMYYPALHDTVIGATMSIDI